MLGKMPRRRYVKKIGKAKKISKDPVVYFDPKNLPIEVWNQVFKHNSGEDLLKLSLVCKSFYQTIGNLPDAMEKIKLKIGKFEGILVFRKTVKCMLKSSRSYTNLSIQTDKVEKISKILKKFGPNLRLLEFNFGSQLSEKDFFEILELTHKSLRSLQISCTKLSEGSTEKNFKLVKLENLDISYCDLDVFNLLLGVLPDTLLDVRFHCMVDDEKFVKFLENQKNLKRLALQLKEDTDFLKMISDADIKFELENFAICFEDCIINTKKFDAFLKSQAESLKFLELGNISMHWNSAFEFMPKLEKLEMYRSEKPYDVTYEAGPKFCCPSLKTLVLNYRKFNDGMNDLEFFGRFDGVQEIVFKTKISSLIMKRIADNFPDLKKLVLTKFNDKSFDSVSFENLEELEITFLYKAANDEDLNMENTIFAMRNLKVLKIGEAVNVSAKSLLWILVHFKQLKHLEVHNGSELTDRILCSISQFFKNLDFFGANLDSRCEKFIECLEEFPDLKHSFPKNSKERLTIEDHGDDIYNYEDTDSDDDGDYVSDEDFSASDIEDSDDDIDIGHPLNLLQFLLHH